MKVSQGIKESGVYVGNTFDKYHSKNPVVQYLMRGYESSLAKMVGKVRPELIHEVGCGEGYWTLKWGQQGIKVKGSDFSATVIKMAVANAAELGLSPDIFRVRDIYNLDPLSDKADLVVCCQVLEHLERPEEALLCLQQVADPYLIVCVPEEPVWRILNMARGKYLGQRGNTPGHIQHWSGKEFKKIVSRCFDILETDSPFPWTMLLCRVRRPPL